MEFLITKVAPLAQLIGIVVGPSIALLIFFLGRSAYYRQKEFELARDRYLNEGLDQLVLRADYALQIFNHNWAHSLNVVKTVRDLKKNANISVFLEDLRAPDPKLLELSVNRRVCDIIKSEITYDIHQLLASFVHNAFLMMRDDLGNAIRLYIEEAPEFAGNLTSESIQEQYVPVLLELSEKSNKYHFFVRQIQELAHLLQREKFSFKAVGSFASRSDVKRIVAELEAYYSEDVERAKSPNKGFNRTQESSGPTKTDEFGGGAG